MKLWCKHSGARIMTNTRIEQNPTTVLELDSAKNMTVSGQICMREIWDFEILGVEFSNLPKGVTAEYNFVENVLFNDGVPYPDILSKKTTDTVKRHCTEVIWVTFRVGKDARKGSYKIKAAIKVLCRGAETVHEATFSLSVYSVTLPDIKNQSMSHEYFYNPYTYFPYKETPAPERVPAWFSKFERYSDEWWKFFDENLNAVKELRVNTFYIMALTLLADAGSKRVSENEWEFNFSIMDKVVEKVLDSGNFKRLAIEATMVCATGDSINCLDEKGGIEKINYTENTATVWAEKFFTALYNHFKEKGWLNILYMHLQDEPHQKETWLWIREIAKRRMPGVPCGEPIDMKTVATELKGECQLYIPRIDEYEKNVKYFKNRQKKGDELWCYSCCFPEEPYMLNKFLDLPHAYSRQMHWACFSQGITGFLHWGLAYWFEANYGMTPDSRFKGDGYIIYPDAENNSVLLSARAVATRDGVQEYELLSMLAKKDKKKAMQISKKVAKIFSDFNKDENCMDEARKKILNLLEK